MSHSHSHSATGEKNIRLAFLLNLCSAVIELLVGLWTNSLVILSQALHDASDTLSLGLSWYFAKLATKERSKELSYGYRRYSVLAAIITSAFVIAASVFVLAEAASRLMHPEHSDAPKMLVFAIIGIATNGYAVLRLKKGTSMNEKAAMWHLMDDVLGWLAVLVVSIMMQIRDIHILDPLFAIGISLYVVWNVLKNVRQSVSIFMQGVPDDIDSEHIESLLSGIPNVRAVHDTHIWSLDGEQNVITTHLVLKKGAAKQAAGKAKTKAKQLLSQNDIQHSTIEIEEYQEACDLDEC